jgi:GxxExxY protein
LEAVSPGESPEGVFPEEAATSAGEGRAETGNRTQIHPVRCSLSNRVNADFQDFKHKELTEQIIKIFYRVYNKLGYGFLEKVYENAMMLELKKEGVPAVVQSPIKVFYDEEVVGEYFADILVADEVIVEIKAASCLVEENEAQLLNYLKATDIEVGLLLNFGAKQEVRRKAFSNMRK